MSQKLDFLKNHLAQFSNTLNQEGTKEIKDDVLWSAGAQNMDANGYQVSDLQDIEFHW